MYARMTMVQIKPGAMDEMIAIWEGRVVAQLTKQQGYTGDQLFTDRAGNKAVSITYWATREDAERMLHSAALQQIVGLFTDTFAGPPTREHYEVARDERAESRRPEGGGHR